jgi:hypothetical protein
MAVSTAAVVMSPDVVSERGCTHAGPGDITPNDVAARATLAREAA